MKALRSLQARVLALALAALALIWLVSAAMIWIDTRHELDELLDGHLAQAAALLVVHQTQAEGDDDGVAGAHSPYRHAPRVAFQVFHHGVLTLRSSNAPLEPLSLKESGFETVRGPHGPTWRTLATPGAEPDVRVVVAERIEARRAILGALARSVLLPLGLALPALALALWWSVRRGLRPLHTLRHTLEQRQPDALAPVDDTNLPPELQPLVQALNTLLQRMAALLESERRCTADAAHELRTPIAAIRMQAQVALGAGTDDSARSHALHATLAGCDRATRLVEQLLALARLEAPALGNGPARCDAAQTTRAVLAELAPAALARGQSVTLDAPDSAALGVDEIALRMLVRNLVDNALRYSPDGASVHVQLTPAPGQLLWQVDDSGPGLDDAQAQRLGERFFRVLGSGQSGSGLGWSIVRRIAQVQGATVQVQRSAALGGLCVQVRWPAP